MKKLPTTIELVNELLNESKEVKTSNGGTESFRSVMDFVLTNTYYQDDEKVIRRSKKEIAKLLEENFSKDVITQVKSIYEKLIIENGFNVAAQNLHNK